MWRHTNVRYSDDGRTVVLRPPDLKARFGSLWRSLRFWTANLLLLTLISAVFVYGLWARADVWKFYPSACLGNWENVEHALGKPDLGEGASYLGFTADNSARLTGSGSHIFCANFKSDDDLDLKNNRILQARLTLSLAYVLPAAPAAGGTVEEIREALEDVVGSSSMSTTSDPSESSTEAVPAASSSESSVSPEIVPEAPPPSAAESGSPADETTSEPPAPAPETPASEPSVENPPSEPAPLPEAPASWLRFIPLAFAEAVTSTGTASSSTPPAETTLEVPFEIGSSSLSEAPTEQILTDLLEVSYSIDGNTWNLVSDIVIKDAERVTFTLPLDSWQEIENLQVDVKGLLAGEEVPVIYLDGMELEVVPEQLAEEEAALIPEPAPEEGPAATSTPEPALPGGEEIVFDAVAEHSCAAEPFQVRLAAGETEKIALRFTPTAEFASSSPGIRLGMPPQGIDAKLGYEAGEYFIRLTASRRALPGSYSASVIYWQEGEEPRSHTFCQYNLILE